MKKITSGFLFLFSGLVFNTAVHAAPVTYRADNWWHIFETHSSADGSSVQDVGVPQFLVPFMAPLSVTFNYDASVQLTPTVVQPDTSEVDYLAAFDATGALTGIGGTIVGQSFNATPSATTNFSYILLKVYPGTDVSTTLDMVGTISGAAPEFTRASDAQVFRLTGMSFSFRSGPDVGVLPSIPSNGMGPSNTYVEMLFTGDEDDKVVAKFYMGELTQVPLPGAAWLFGSAVLGPIALRMRRRRQ